MILLKKLINIIIITTILSCSIEVVASAKVGVLQPVKVGVLLYKFDDTYVQQVRKSLEEIQRENQGKIEFTFFDGKGDQNIQNESIDKLLNDKVDLLFVNLVDIDAAKTVINKVKEANVPVILFNREPKTTEAIKSYNKAIYVGTDSKEAGVLQGKIIINEWNTNRKLVDKNKDGIMQYIMLKGEANNLEAIGRTKSSISTIQNAGIKTEELALKVGNWNKQVAHEAMHDLFSRYGNRIEVIISNNDDMAIGAIEALQEYGYNKGGDNKTIQVVGVDATPEAQELINKGYMTGSVYMIGSVFQDAGAMADALYESGMNLVSGKKATEGTKYKFDDTGVSIRIPYEIYTKK